jgi:4-carboxymuconolactone decarboxylase
MNARGEVPVSDDRYRVGEAVRREVLGDSHMDLAQASRSDIDEAFERFVTESVWGTVWARPDLDRRTRSMLVIALLAQQGQEEELARHLRATRNTGVGAAEVRETILMVAAYAGTPAANRAMRIAKQVHGEEQGTAP